jgi:zinc/manganese transport system permease protein
MSLYDIILLPFIDHEFMRRALAACIIITASGTPLGIFLVLRRMTLMSDVTSHAILPGVAIAFFISGVATWPMTIGGLIAGLLVAIVAGAITRITNLKEDASFTAAYLMSLSFGILMISMKGGDEELIHILFGDVFQMNNESIFFAAGVATISLLVMAIIYRPLIIECFDPSFLKTKGKSGTIYHQLFLILMVLNLVTAFQIMGTLMAVGIIILPPIATRLWTNNMDLAIIISIASGTIASAIGLLISYHYKLPASSSIVLINSAWYLLSVFIGRSGGILARFYPRKHFHYEK